MSVDYLFIKTVKDHGKLFKHNLINIHEINPLFCILFVFFSFFLWNQTKQIILHFNLK